MKCAVIEDVPAEVY